MERRPYGFPLHKESLSQRQSCRDHRNNKVKATSSGYCSRSLAYSYGLQGGRGLVSSPYLLRRPYRRLRLVYACWAWSSYCRNCRTSRVTLIMISTRYIISSIGTRPNPNDSITCAMIYAFHENLQSHQACHQNQSASFTDVNICYSQILST